jgi:MFS family permease
MATDLIPSDLRSTGIGIYSTVIGLTSLVASIVGGFLWDKINPSATFLYGAIFAAAGIVALLTLTKNRKPLLVART